MIKIKSIFPKNKNEIELVEFIGRYQYLLSNDTKYFFNDTYYPKRITRLVKNGILRRYKKYLVLAKNGKYFLEISNKNPAKLRYQKKYADRLKFMSHLAAQYQKEDYVSFIPSFEIKEKTVFTETARKFIGILTIFGTKYLTYHISEDHTQKYKNSVIYDLQKETTYKNILILVNDISRINLKDFTFGFNSVLVVEDNDEKLQELKYLHQIDWSKSIKRFYKAKVHLSEYNFCDYTDNKDKYITTFSFIDTEKIYRVNMFIKNNEQKKADIICNTNIENHLKNELPFVNLTSINISDYIEKDVRLYD